MTLPGPAETALAARGLFIDELDFEPVDDRAIVGVIAYLPVEPAVFYGIYVRPGTADDVREQFAAWVTDELERVGEVGPEAAGWRQGRNGQWQRRCRGLVLPTAPPA